VLESANLGSDLGIANKQESLPRLGGKTLVVLLSATALTPWDAFGQNGTWLSSPGSSNFNTPGNWLSGSVPTGTATFGSSTTTNLTLSNGVTLGASSTPERPPTRSTSACC
jgi:hypothetical protein